MAPTKPPEPGFDGFVGALPAESTEIWAFGSNPATGSASRKRLSGEIPQSLVAESNFRNIFRKSRRLTPYQGRRGVDAGGTISAWLATTNSKWPVVPIDVRTHIGVRLAVVRLSGVVETIV